MPSTSSKGRPAEKPSASMRRLAGSSASRALASQLRSAGAAVSVVKGAAAGDATDSAEVDNFEGVEDMQAGGMRGLCLLFSHVLDV
ncbi:hypothetical protein GCM10028785_34100 [Hydrogenophaga soli]